MDGIALGCIAGWLSERRPPGFVAARLAMTVGVAAVALIIVFRKTTVALGLGANGLYVTVLEVGMALVLLAIASGVGERFFSRGTSLLRTVGRCSYEVYLTHMFVVFGFFRAFEALYEEAGAVSGDLSIESRDHAGAECAAWLCRVSLVLRARQSALRARFGARKNIEAPVKEVQCA